MTIDDLKKRFEKNFGILSTAESIVEITKALGANLDSYRNGMKAMLGVESTLKATRAALGYDSPSARAALFGLTYNAAVSGSAYNAAAKGTAQLAANRDLHLAATSMQKILDEHKRAMDLVNPKITGMSDYMTAATRASEIMTKTLNPPDYLKELKQVSEQVKELTKVPKLTDQLNPGKTIMQQMRESQLARSNHLQMLEETTIAPPYEPAFVPLPRRRKQQEVKIGIVEFCENFQQQLGEYQKEAEETGQKLIVTCKSPSGETIHFVSLTTLDAHFVSVEGVDFQGKRRKFKSHYNAIAPAFELIEAYEEIESKETDDLVN